MIRSLLLVFIASALHAQYPGEQWEKLTDEEARAAGWSREKLASARKHAETLKTEAVLIVTRGKVLDSWGAVDQKFNIHSIRKSFISAMCGIQAEKGVLKLDATMESLGIDDNPPALTGVEKKATVLQLLQARSGIYHPALYETESMKKRRPVRHSHAPGTFWYYNNWDFNALGTIYEQTTQSGIYTDFQRLIAAPIGMQDYTPADGEYVSGEDSIHRAYPFRMTARDMARFGLLYLNDGKWNGTQVVPAAWVRDSIANSSDAGTSGGYGYLWWVEKNGIHLPGVTLPQGSYSARGAGGHYILVIPRFDLIVVHRVNTDIESNKVESAEFGSLLQKILAAYSPSPLSANAPVPEALETLVPLLMSRHKVLGVAVVGIENRRVAWSKYLGTKKAGENAPVDENTLFEAASMTKPLAAYAAVKLMEQGRLDLDKPLVSYLDKPYLEDEPLHQKITARMVLSHTSGFPNWRPDGKPLRVLHEPGTAHLYSGEGFLFLQRVMEKITGEDYEPLLQHMLLGPLAMKHSSHVWQEARAADASAGHEGWKPKENRRLYRQPNSAYTLYCTAEDYARFVQEMMNPDRSAAWSVSEAGLRLMATPNGPTTGRSLLTRRGSKGTGESHFGLGWNVEPTASGNRLCHGGSNGTGFRSRVEFDPAKGHGLIILTNSTTGAAFCNDLISFIGIP